VGIVRTRSRVIDGDLMQACIEVEDLHSVHLVQSASGTMSGKRDGRVMDMAIDGKSGIKSGR
jgi:hypothetical protein